MEQPTLRDTKERERDLFTTKVSPMTGIKYTYKVVFLESSNFTSLKVMPEESNEYDKDTSWEGNGEY